MITKIIRTHVCHITKIDIFIRNQFFKILCVPTVWAGTSLDTVISWPTGTGGFQNFTTRCSTAYIYWKRKVRYDNYDFFSVLMIRKYDRKTSQVRAHRQHYPY